MRYPRTLKREQHACFRTAIYSYGTKSAHHDAAIIVRGFNFLVLIAADERYAAEMHTPPAITDRNGRQRPRGSFTAETNALRLKTIPYIALA